MEFHFSNYAAKIMTVGEGRAFYAVTDDGALYMWGENDYVDVSDNGKRAFPADQDRPPLMKAEILRSHAFLFFCQCSVWFLLLFSLHLYRLVLSLSFPKNMLLNITGLQQKTVSKEATTYFKSIWIGDRIH